MGRLSSDTRWHNVDPETAARLLQVDVSNGLDAAEAQRRLQQYGPNLLPAAPPAPLWMRFLRQFNNLLIYVLLAAAIITVGV